jgi:curved DNA-binding protein CbpA
MIQDYYSLLGVKQTASTRDIKRAFREKAKQLHPDIAGKAAEDAMRKLIAAYEVLSDRDRRCQYDLAYSRFIKKISFDYRTFLRGRPDDPVSQAKLVEFELFHFEEDAAIEVWDQNGGLEFPMEKYLEKEDWMDCVYVLAEELDKRNRSYEAFMLLADLIREERRRPYYKQHMEDIEIYLKELVRLRLKNQVDGDTWVDCMETLLGLGFSPRDEARWMRSMAETLFRMGDEGAAESIIREALRRDPGLPGTAQIRRKLKV